MATDIFPWAKKILIPGLYYTHDYNGNPRSQYDEEFLANTFAYRLGPPRMRQLRVKQGILLFIKTGKLFCANAFISYYILE